jgi:hypothetical protein
VATRRPGLEEDHAPFGENEANPPAPPLAIRPAGEPEDVEHIAARIIERFPRILAKLAE